MGHHLIEFKEDQPNMAEGGECSLLSTEGNSWGVEYPQTHPTKVYKKQTPSLTLRLVYSR